MIFRIFSLDRIDPNDYEKGYIFDRIFKRREFHRPVNFIPLELRYGFGYNSGGGFLGLGNLRSSWMSYENEGVSSFSGGNFSSRLGHQLDIDILKNRLILRSQITINYKGEDNYVSKMPEWDAWMEEYAGNMPYFSKVDLECEMLFLNSLSSERFGPYSFDLSAGFKSTLSANNTYSDFVLYSTLSTYYQSW